MVKSLADLRTENKRLINEREKLRALVKDREEDVKVMRAQLIKDQREKINPHKETMKKEELARLVRQLESLRMKYSNRRQDLRVPPLNCHIAQCFST